MNKFTKFSLAIAVVLAVGTSIAVTVSRPTVTVPGPNGPITISLVNTPSVFPPNAAAVRVMPPTRAFEINAKALMTKKDGASNIREKDTTFVPNSLVGSGGGLGGLFRTLCRASHMLFDDPIVYPGQPGKSHLHTFFGNSTITGSSDVAGTNLATLGKSSCLGGILNRSAYWVPALIDIRTGKPLQPGIVLIYYKNDDAYYGGSDSPHRNEIQVPPVGLRMIAGNPSNATENFGDNYSWECIDTPSTVNGPHYPHDKGPSIPSTACSQGDDLTMVIDFPHCWDGVNLDSPSHGAATVNGVPGHMNYGDFYTGCPSTHPVALPHISYHVRYNIANKDDVKYWRLSSDNYPTTVPAGRSVHGDWINGWDQTYFAKIRDNCWHQYVDCSVGFSNDGKTIY